MKKEKSIFRGWVIHAWKKEDSYVQIIKLQKYVIGVMTVLSLAFFVGWQTAPSRLTLYIPPEIQNGATIKAGSIPPSSIYSFAYEIWQELNYWHEETGENYQENIRTYWSYLTPQFKNILLDESNELKNTGQLQRIRYLQGVSGAAFEPMNVKQIAKDTWEVKLKMRLTEYKNNQAIKDIDILYPLKITRENVSPQNNPYGLVIAGFVSEPIRLKTYI
jgi:integrating conjugative element protein (TIGR03746 family)